MNVSSDSIRAALRRGLDNLHKCIGRERRFRCRCCAQAFAEGAGRDDELAIEVEPCPIGYRAVATNRYDGAPDGDRRVGYGATPAEAEAALRELYEENEHD